MIDIKILELNYFQNEEPVPYNLKKGGDILIYPIKVIDYPMYEWCKYLFEIDKNLINDINIIQMTDLEYIVKELIANSSDISSRFATLFDLCLKKRISIVKDKGKDCIALCNEEGVIEGIITSKEFNEIKKIILFQNDKDYDDTYVNPDVKKAYEDYALLLNKTNNYHSPTLEEQKTYVMSKTGYNMKDINNMIYRTFNQIFTHCINSEIYLSQKIIQASFKYDVKEDIKHPLYEKKVNKYEAMFKDAESFEKQVQAVNG